MRSTQVGGDHYAADYQHWDWAVDVRLGSLETAGSKYAFRWYKKNGVQDLDKARSYLLKVKECFLEGRWDNRCLHVDTWPLARDKAETMFDTFANSAGVPQVEADLCLSMAQWRNDVDLSIIIGTLSAHISAVEAHLAKGGTLGPLAPLSAPARAGAVLCGRTGGTTAPPPASGASTGVTRYPITCSCGWGRQKNQHCDNPECGDP